MCAFASFQILVPVADGSEEMEATIIIDILQRAKAEVVVASVEEKLEIVATRNVKLVADVFLDEALNSSYDLVVLPVSWMQFFRTHHHSWTPWLNQILYVVGWTSWGPNIR